MSEDNREARDEEKTLAVALITAAAGAIGVIAISVGNVITHTQGSLTVVFLSLVGLSVIALISSIIFGGRGIIRGPKYSGFKGRFNLQALSGLAGLIFLFGAYGLAFLFSSATLAE